MHPISCTLKTQIVLLCLLLSACTGNTVPSRQPLPDILQEAAQLVTQKNQSEAIDLLEEAEDIYPASPAPLTQLGQIYITQQRWILAEDAFNRALARDLDNPLATAGLAEVYLNQGKYQEALDLWQQAAAASPDLAGVFTGLGRTYLARLAFDEAKDAFLAQQRHQIDAEAWWYLAALIAPLDGAQANEYLDSISSEAPDEILARRDYLRDTLETAGPTASQAEAAQAVGVAMVQAELWPLAIHALTLAAEAPRQSNQEKAETLAFLGHALAQAGRPAFDFFEQAQQLNPNSALPAYFQGIYLRQQGALRAAEQYLKQAIQLDPANAAIHLELAQTKAEQGNLSAAEEQYFKAVEIEPDNLAIQMLQVRFYANRSYRLAEAGIPATEALVEADQNNAEAYELLGWMQFLVGELTEAESNLRQAIDLDPNLVSARYRLGRYLETTGEFEAAKQAYRQVIEQDHSGLFREKAWEGLNRIGDKQ